MPNPRPPVPRVTVLKHVPVLEQRRAAVADAERAEQEATAPLRPLREREQQLEIAIRNAKDAVRQAATVEAMTRTHHEIRALEAELADVRERLKGVEAILGRLRDATERARHELSVVEHKIHTLDNPFGGGLQVQRGIIATQKRVIAERERQLQAERDALVTMEQREVEILAELRKLRGEGERDWHAPAR